MLIGIAGAGASAYGSYESGQYQSQVANNNAIIEKQNADYARQAGQQEAASTSMKGAAEGARIKTAQAANGVDVNTGSAADVQESQRETSQLDAETVLNNADLKAYGYTTQATNDEAQGQQDAIGGDLGAAGSLLSNASSIGLRWSQTPSGSTSWGG